MVARGLDNSIRKKLDTQYLRYMAQLVDRVRQVERLKAENARVNRNKKERVAYVDIDDNEQASKIKYRTIKGNELDVARLKPGPSYVCKVLTPVNRKKHVEPDKTYKFPKKTYTFNVTKCDEIFNLLVADGKILVSQEKKCHH